MRVRFLPVFGAVLDNVGSIVLPHELLLDGELVHALQSHVSSSCDFCRQAVHGSENPWQLTDLCVWRGWLSFL